MRKYGTVIAGCGFGADLIDGSGSTDTTGHAYGDARPHGQGYGCGDAGSNGSGHSHARWEVSEAVATTYVQRVWDT